MKGQVHHEVKLTCFTSTKVQILTLTRLAGDVVKRVEEEHAQKVAKLNQIKDSLGHVRALTTTVGGLKCPYYYCRRP